MLGRKRKQSKWKIDGFYATKLLAQKAVKRLRKDGYQVRGYKSKKSGRWVVRYTSD